MVAVKARKSVVQVGKHSLKLSYMKGIFQGTDVDPEQEFVHFKPVRWYKFAPCGYYNIRKLEQEFELVTSG